MKSLLMFAPNPTDGTSFYRAVGPLQSLKRTAKKPFQIFQTKEASWASMKSADAVFMQRPFTKNHLMTFEMAKANGKPVWLDYDDDLYCVPFSNRTHGVYSLPDHQNNITKMICKADAITVSTQALKDKLSNVLKAVKEKGGDAEAENNLSHAKVIVAPNAYDNKLFSHYRKDTFKKNQNKLVSWRGSDTHDKDLFAYTLQMKSAFSKHLDWTFNFVGSPFWYTIESLDSINGLKPNNVILTEAMDPIELFKFLWVTAPAMMVVPLFDSEFNRSKSNIAWIEGTHAGAVALAPDWEEWRKPGVINYKDQKEFEEKMDLFMRGEFNGRALYEQSWEYIQEHLTLEKVNARIREPLLEALFES